MVVAHTPSLFRYRGKNGGAVSGDTIAEHIVVNPGLAEIVWRSKQVNTSRPCDGSSTPLLVFVVRCTGEAVR
jgi:hypothetical protein